MKILLAIIKFRVLIAQLLGLAINAKRFGAVGNGVADDTAAVQSALDYMVANNVSLFFPAGTYLVTSTLTISGKFLIYGEGSRSVIKTTDTTIPLITIGINTTTILHPYIRDIQFQGPQSADVASCALRFTGDATALIQHGIFSNIICTDFNAFVKDEKLPRTTSHGLEAMLNWNIWDNIQIYNASNYGFWLTQGSGTGNTWTNIKSMLRNAGAPTWFFDGSGCVVGDVIIEGAHLGSRTAGGVGIKVGDSTVYRTRWSISGSQFDANCDIPVLLSSTGSTEYTNWKFTNNNVGGSALLGGSLHYMSGSVIEDKDVDRREAGRFITTSSTGALTTDCFDIDLDSYGSALVTVIANGIIGGVSAAASQYQFYISTTGAAMTITALESTLTANDQLTWAGASISVNKARLTLGYTPSSTGTAIHTNVHSRGRKYKLTILEAA